LLGRWFSPGTLASSTTKTGRNDTTEILLKVALNTKKKKKKSDMLKVKRLESQEQPDINL
jgi:hypothetical protein